MQICTNVCARAYSDLCAFVFVWGNASKNRTTRRPCWILYRLPWAQLAAGMPNRARTLLQLVMVSMAPPRILRTTTKPQTQVSLHESSNVNPPFYIPLLARSE